MSRNFDSDMVASKNRHSALDAESQTLKSGKIAGQARNDERVFRGVHMELVCATKNKGKAAEIAALLPDEFKVLSLDELGIVEDIDEDGETFEENAIKKAVGYMKLTGKTVLADDSGLEIDALNGAPGVYSARFLGRDTPYAKKNQKLLQMLQYADNRSARFCCVIAVAFPDGRVLSATSTLTGEIAYEPAGDGGFGYDPVFYIPEYQMTLAQMNAEQKNKISHRAKALAEIKRQLTVDS